MDDFMKALDQIDPSTSAVYPTPQLIIVPQEPYKSKSPFETVTLCKFNIGGNGGILLSAALKEGFTRLEEYQAPVYMGDVSEKASIRIAASVVGAATILARLTNSASVARVHAIYAASEYQNLR